MFHCIHTSASDIVPVVFVTHIFFGGIFTLKSSTRWVDNLSSSSAVLWISRRGRFLWAFAVAWSIVLFKSICLRDVNLLASFLLLGSNWCAAKWTAFPRRKQIPRSKQEIALMISPVTSACWPSWINCFTREITVPGVIWSEGAECSWSILRVTSSSTASNLCAICGARTPIFLMCGLFANKQWYFDNYLRNSFRFSSNSLSKFSVIMACIVCRLGTPVSKLSCLGFYQSGHRIIAEHNNITSFLLRHSINRARIFWSDSSDLRAAAAPLIFSTNKCQCKQWGNLYMCRHVLSRCWRFSLNDLQNSMCWMYH